MKRDFDYVRKLLLDIEGGQTEFETIEPDDEEEQGDSDREDKERLGYHLHIMSQAGLIDVMSVTFGGYYLRGLTWEGHDFLDTIRDPEVWRKTKEGAGKVGGLTFGLVKDLGTAYLKHVAKERLGLDL